MNTIKLRLQTLALFAFAAAALIVLPSPGSFLIATVILFAGAHALVTAQRGDALAATWTNLDNEIFSNKVLEGYVTALMPINVFSTDHSSEAASSGANVLVPLIGALTATTFGGNYAISGGTASVITVPLNRHKVVHTGQGDMDAANSSMANLERFGFQRGMALGIAVLQDIFSLLTTANFGIATSVSVVDFALTQIRAVRKVLTEGKAPLMDRHMILDLDPFDNLLGVSNFLQANLAGNNEALREGRVGRAMGFDVFETDALPGTNSIMGFAGHASAIAVASRYLAPQAGNTYNDARPITDPETGLTVGLRDFYDNASGERFIILEANYGFVAGITLGARLLKRND